MRRSEDFTDAVRGGVRSGSRRLVVHLARPQEASADDPLVGLVVSKAVGNAVVRNRVKRRLRGRLADRVDQLESGARLVVRALPAAGTASGAELEADLTVALDRAARRQRAAR